jgi:DNA-3-methyladenine glycosylase
MLKLTERFYHRKDVAKIARELIGKKLITNISGKFTSGMIVETEAYSFMEKGCHAYNNKLTNRNKVMFEKGGVSYVYLCYGMHNLFNIVTNIEDKAEAVLIRALEPIEGIDWMMNRMNAKTPRKITSGPGKLSKAMGIDRTFYGISLLSDELWVEEFIEIPSKEILISERIGIEYAGDDARLPWRFSIRNNIWVSK